MATQDLFNPTDATKPTDMTMSATADSIKTQAQGIADTSQYTPTTQQFDESKSAAGRVASITSSGSPLMQLAETRAKQDANSRGLLNSSMAVGAAQNAVIGAATPLATADASNYQQQALANQSSLNDAAMRNAAARASALTTGMQLGENARQANQAEAGQNTRFDKQIGESGRQFDVNQAGQTDRFNQELAQKESQFTRGMTHEESMAKLDASMRENLAKLDGQIRENLLGIEAKYKTEIAGNENIANAWGTAMSDISKIQNNPDLDTAAKTALIQNTLAGFQSFTGFWQKATGGAVDVSDLLNFNIASAPGKAADATSPAAAPAAAPATAPAPAASTRDNWWEQGPTGGG